MIGSGPADYPAPVTRYVSIDAADAALPELAVVLEQLRAQRAELLRLRDLVAAGDGLPSAASAAAGSSSSGEGSVADAAAVRLRMSGIIDRMQAGALRIEVLGASLRDIESGLIDFPALVSGRPVWLCWRLGEAHRIAWWHDHETGFAGRRPLAELA